MAAKGSNEDPKGLYATLGVPPTADFDAIRKAYRRLALKWHPDKNPDNPDATAEFQKISAAYEVLSDAERREMYDTTGCIDAEEMDDGDMFEHAADIFAAMFGGGLFTEAAMDAEEKAMFDEFIRITGGGAFKSRRPRRKKGRQCKAARSGPSSSRGSKAQEEALFANMFGDMEEPVPECPKGHKLKKKKADAEFECDSCNKDIAKGKRIFECKKCDYCLCQKCYTKAEEELMEKMDEDEEEEMEAELLAEFCEALCPPKMIGGKLQYQCEICGKKATFSSKEKAQEHLMEKHMAEFEAFKAECEEGMMGGLPGMGAMGGMGMGGLEMMMMMDLLGGMGPPGGGYEGGGGKGKKKRR
eukprot:TRINITY_DN81918_c0_g1_i1.p2 TRINITY_DN81918_c0_g1~~TRINITY_DN81918_c0_g1_i1.p2  ORF type:complete len:357 (-),score=128.32 TRINITY_DN81918_c0_g1_i1:78-1148(-)